MKKYLKSILIIISFVITKFTYAIEDNQIVICETSCTNQQAENMAISNRYGRSSEISVINSNDWSVRTFRVLDSSESGQTLIDSWEIETSNEIINTLNELKSFENELKQLNTESNDFSLVYRPEIKEIKVSVPTNISHSVTEIFGNHGAGANYDLNTYLRTKIIPLITNKSIWQKIFSKTKGYSIIAVFDDKSTIQYTLVVSSSTIAWAKQDSTALMPDGTHYDPYGGGIKYKDAKGTIDVEYRNGNYVLRITQTKICGTYTKTSSDGSTWTGTICWYSYVR